MTRLIALTAKYSACLVLAVYLLATPPLLAVLLLVLSILASHRALRLLKERSTSTWLFEQYPDLDPPDKRWLIHHEKIWRHK